MDLLNKNYSNIPVETIKKEYGYNVKDKVLLFIGRIEEEKRPIDLVHIFYKLHKLNPNYKLLIVGKGALHQELIKEIRCSNLDDSVQYIKKIPNSEIWKLYRLSYAFLNLNKQEIFGMVIMEAMYYETNVIAFHASGPDYIIDNGINGILVSTDQEMINAILSNKPELGREAHGKNSS